MLETCPRCDVELKTETVLALSRMCCPSCRGQWFSHQQLADLCDKMQFDMATAFDLSKSVATSTLACPTCGSPMGLLPLSRIELDLCRSHGVWFDAKELKKVLDKIAPDGTGLSRDGLDLILDPVSSVLGRVLGAFVSRRK